MTIDIDIEEFVAKVFSDISIDHEYHLIEVDASERDRPDYGTFELDGIRPRD